MSSDQIVILCDANETTGLGHVSRCISLALALKEMGQHTYLQGNFNQSARMLASYYNIDLIHQKSSIVERASKLAQNTSIVIDSYAFEPSALPRSQKYLLIDDFCKHESYENCAVLNFTFAANNYNYAEKGAISQALGLNFYLPHPAISGKFMFPSASLTKFLVMIGGTNPDQISERVARSLYNIDMRFDVKVVFRPEWSFEKHELDKYKAIPPTPSVDLLYDWADLIVTSGGLAKYESAYLGKPAAVISITEAEARETAQFSEAGLCFDLGKLPVSNALLQTQLSFLIKSSKQRAFAHAQCRHFFSGQSAKNAAKFAINRFSGVYQ